MKSLVHIKYLDDNLAQSLDRDLAEFPHQSFANPASIDTFNCVVACLRKASDIPEEAEFKYVVEVYPAQSVKDISIEYIGYTHPMRRIYPHPMRSAYPRQIACILSERLFGKFLSRGTLNYEPNHPQRGDLYGNCALRSDSPVRYVGVFTTINQIRKALNDIQEF